MSRSIFQEEEDMGVKAPDAEGCTHAKWEKQHLLDGARGSPGGVKNPNADVIIGSARIEERKDDGCSVNQPHERRK